MQVVGAFQNDYYHLVVMERCEGITLFQCVELNSALPESVARMISKQVQASHIMFSTVIYIYIFRYFPQYLTCTISPLFTATLKMRTLWSILS